MLQCFEKILALVDRYGVLYKRRYTIWVMALLGAHDVIKDKAIMAVLLDFASELGMINKRRTLKNFVLDMYHFDAFCPPCPFFTEKN